MNKQIQELAADAGIYYYRKGKLQADAEKLTEVVAKECVALLQKEWYRLNNLPAVENESPRDIGMRVGAKSKLIMMMSVINNHFGIEE